MFISVVVCVLFSTLLTQQLEKVRMESKWQWITLRQLSEWVDSYTPVQTYPTIIWTRRQVPSRDKQTEPSSAKLIRPHTNGLSALLPFSRSLQKPQVVFSACWGLLYFFPFLQGFKKQYRQESQLCTADLAHSPQWFQVSKNTQALFALQLPRVKGPVTLSQGWGGGHKSSSSPQFFDCYFLYL